MAEEHEGYGRVGMLMTIPIEVSEELQHQLEALFICVELCAWILFLGGVGAWVNPNPVGGHI